MKGSDAILDGAASADVALLVVGDPFGATTHADLALRARQQGVPTRAVHNAREEEQSGWLSGATQLSMVHGFPLTSSDPIAIDHIGGRQTL